VSENKFLHNQNLKKASRSDELEEEYSEYLQSVRVLFNKNVTAFHLIS